MLLYFNYQPKYLKLKEQEKRKEEGKGRKRKEQEGKGRKRKEQEGRKEGKEKNQEQRGAQCEEDKETN